MVYRWQKATKILDAPILGQYALMFRNSPRLKLKPETKIDSIELLVHLLSLALFETSLVGFRPEMCFCQSLHFTAHWITLFQFALCSHQILNRNNQLLEKVRQKGTRFKNYELTVSHFRARTREKLGIVLWGKPILRPHQSQTHFQVQQQFYKRRAKKLFFLASPSWNLPDLTASCQD